MVCQGSCDGSPCSPAYSLEAESSFRSLCKRSDPPENQPPLPTAGIQLVRGILLRRRPRGLGILCGGSLRWQG